MNVRKLGVLASLYLAQGLPFGFFTQALPAVMRERKYSLEEIGLASLLAMPWALKFLWAPLIDRFGSSRFGRRRSFILPLQVATILLLIALSTIAPDASMAPILWGVLLVNLFAATQDVATDGLAVDTLEAKERGVANGIQVAGYRVGMIIGGGALLMIYDLLKWRGTFLVMAGIVALTTIPIARFREPPPRKLPDRLTPGFLRRGDAFRLLVLIFGFKVGVYLLQGMLRPFLIDGGLTLPDIGLVLGTVGFTAGLGGAMVGGALVNRLGRRRALILFGLLQTASVLAFVPLALSRLDIATVAVVSAAEHFASGMATTALFTAMMDWSSEESSASDYTLQACAVVVATGAASAASGFIAGAVGYAAHFAIATAVSVVGVVLAAMLFPKADPRSGR